MSGGSKGYTVYSSLYSTLPVNTDTMLLYNRRAIGECIRIPNIKNIIRNIHRCGFIG